MVHPIGSFPSCALQPTTVFPVDWTVYFMICWSLEVRSNRNGEKPRNGFVFFFQVCSFYSEWIFSVTNFLRSLLTYSGVFDICPFFQITVLINDSLDNTNCRDVGHRNRSYERNNNLLHEANPSKRSYVRIDNTISTIATITKMVSL